MRDVKKYPPPCSENLGLAVLRHASECAAGVGVGVGGGGGQVRAFTEANGEGGRAAAIVASLPTGLPTEAETAAAGFALTEAARAQALAVRLNKLLDSFPTTVEEDERLLTQNLNSRRRAAVGYRLERKRLVRVARDALLMYSSVVSPGP